MQRIRNMQEEEVFTRIVFGIVLIAAAFIPGGRWIAFVLGVLFLISAFQGFCITCALYKKFRKKSS